MTALRRTASFCLLLLGAHGPRRPARVAWKPFEKGLKDAAAPRNTASSTSTPTGAATARCWRPPPSRPSPCSAGARQELRQHQVQRRERGPGHLEGQEDDHARTLPPPGAWKGFPTMLFLNSKGEIIGSFASFADARPDDQPARPTSPPAPARRRCPSRTSSRGALLMVIAVLDHRGPPGPHLLGVSPFPAGAAASSPWRRKHGQSEQVQGLHGHRRP